MRPLQLAHLVAHHMTHFFLPEIHIGARRMARCSSTRFIAYFVVDVVVSAGFFNDLASKCRLSLDQFFILKRQILLPIHSSYMLQIILCTERIERPSLRRICITEDRKLNYNPML